MTKLSWALAGLGVWWESLAPEPEDRLELQES